MTTSTQPWESDHGPSSALNARRVKEATGPLANAALKRLVREEPWYRKLSVQDRSYVGLVAQAGIGAFVAWYEDPARPPTDVGEMFAAAPRELTRAITLQNTLQIVRIAVDVVEANAEQIAEPGSARELREAVLRYSREIAFSAALVYARAAEARGAWDARLEAAVVDTIIRGDADGSLRSRVPALGWKSSGPVAVIVGDSRAGLDEVRAADVRRAARAAAEDALVSIQGDRTVVVLGGSGNHTKAAQHLLEHFGPGHVVVGPTVASLAEAGPSAIAALAGRATVNAWPSAPRLVLADDLLPERVLGGDSIALRTLLASAYDPLKDSGGAVLETLTAYLSAGRSLEAAARGLYVHPNTVRYRLRKVAEITGWDPLDARESFVLHIAMVYGRLAESEILRPRKEL